MIIIHGSMDHNPPLHSRLLYEPLRAALKSFPVVVVTGARQTGKSTLVQHLPRDRVYHSLDDFDVRERAATQPDALLRDTRPITIDEVQREPELLIAVKRAVDARRTPGRFLLTGSANLLLQRRIAETLAGRAIYLTLWPFTRREQRGEAQAGRWSELLDARDEDWPDLFEADAPRDDWRALALRGGYPSPTLQLSTAADRAHWFAGYAQTYLERDVRDLSTVASLVDFRRLMRALCIRVGTLVNQSEVSRDIGLSQPSVHRWMDLLEASYQLVRVPAYAVNRTKRLIKTPKVYWSDAGLAMYLAGETEPRGEHLENLVLSDLLAWRGSTPHAADVLFWRTTTGDEVDFVIEAGARVLPIEVKATSRPALSDAKGLRSFLDEYRKRSRAALLLHTGSHVTWLADRVLAVPWWKVM
jgi:predicted AAA+ superfamily ATPase